MTIDPSFARQPAPGLDPSTIESDPVLVERLGEEIRRAGPITFARFMEVALYDDQRGYYMQPSARPTRDGDFLTAPELHPAFGRLVGRQLAEVWDRLDRPAPFVLREHGAGSGTLGLAIIAGLELDAPALAEVITYEPVELNPERLTDLRRRFSEAGKADRLADGRHVGRPGVVGAIVANELLDALPVHRIRGRDDGRVDELFVDLGPEGFVWLVGPPSTPDLADRLGKEGISLAAGQTAEVCLAIDAWMTDAAASLTRGLLLVIDYGHAAAELYGPSRPDGTLRAYLGHRVHADALRHIGRQDLTAHVDVTAVSQAATSAGLDSLGETSQAEFVAGLGIGDLLEAAGSIEVAADSGVADYLALRAAVARLLDPRALGGFRVLAFGRGIEPVPALRGFAWRSPERP